MRLLRNTILVLSAQIVLSYIYTPAKAAAQSAGLSVSPPVVEILLSPNKKVIQTLNFRNQGESGQFVVNLHPIMPVGENGQVAVGPTPLDPAKTPLVLSLQNADLVLNTPFTLAEGETRQIVIGIEGPSADTTSDFYFAVVVSPVPPSGSNDQPASIPGISSLVLTTLTPDGLLPVNLEIAGFELPYLHDNLTPLLLTAVLKNISPVMLRPEGKLEIISPRNNHNSEIKLYPNLLLGNSIRSLLAQGENLDSPPIPLHWQPRWYQVGPYRLRLTITTIGGTKIQEVEKTVWLLPIKTILISVILILSGLAILRTRRKSAIDTSLQNH